jgi:hypothetical protein
MSELRPELLVAGSQLSLASQEAMQNVADQSGYKSRFYKDVLVAHTHLHENIGALLILPTIASATPPIHSRAWTIFKGVFNEGPSEFAIKKQALAIEHTALLKAQELGIAAGKLILGESKDHTGPALTVREPLVEVNSKPPDMSTWLTLKLPQIVQRQAEKRLALQLQNQRVLRHSYRSSHSA